MEFEQTDAKTAAEELSDRTGRPVEEFEPNFDEAPIPDTDEQDFETTDEA